MARPVQFLISVAISILVVFIHVVPADTQGKSTCFCLAVVVVVFKAVVVVIRLFGLFIHTVLNPRLDLLRLLVFFCSQSSVPNHF